MNEAINPKHYKQGSIECIDAMEVVLTAEEYRGFLKGNAIKYLWREENKGGIEDLRKAKWYLDRLIEHCDESPIDLNKGLVKAWSCDDGKAKQVYPEPKWEPKVGEWVARPCGRLAKVESVSIVGGQIIYGCEGTRTKFTLGTLKPWTPKIGDWVKINKPSETQVSATCWFTDMDKYHGQVIQVNQMEDGGVVHNNWGFLFDWLEPGKAPQQPPKEQPELPDGWRWLDADEVIRKGDAYWHGGKWWDYDNSIGAKVLDTNWPSIRRNRFEVGEKVVRVLNGVVYKVIRLHSMGYQLQDEFGAEVILYGKDLSSYIEDTK